MVFQREAFTPKRIAMWAQDYRSRVAVAKL